MNCELCKIEIESPMSCITIKSKGAFIQFCSLCASTGELFSYQLNADINNTDSEQALFFRVDNKIKSYKLDKIVEKCELCKIDLDSESICIKSKGIYMCFHSSCLDKIELKSKNPDQQLKEIYTYLLKDKK